MPRRGAPYSTRPWTSSGDAIASLPAGSCLSVLVALYAAEPAFRLTWFSARRARFACSSPTKAALRKAPRITARAPSGVARRALTDVLVTPRAARSLGLPSVEIPRLRLGMTGRCNQHGALGVMRGISRSAALVGELQVKRVRRAVSAASRKARFAML